MSDNTVAKESQGVSRRDFLKLSAVAGGTAALFGSGIGAKEAQAKTYDTIDDMIQIDPAEFKRFKQSDVAFMRRMVPAGLFKEDPADNPELMAKIFKQDTEVSFSLGDPGFSQIDQAFEHGGKATYVMMGSSVTGSGMAPESSVNFETPDGKLVPWSMFAQDSKSFPVGGDGFFDVAETKYEFESPKQAAYAIKKAAKVYGADLVGIAPYDERWVYESQVCIPKDMKGEKIMDKVDLNQKVDFGFEPKSVIVLAFEMDYECFKVAGSAIESGATYTGYSRMAEVGLRLAAFIRQLGYNTYHCGNNASLSVPEAIRAGLGEAGRLGLLITEEYGPRVRLAKVYTDLEFEYDKPKSFGVTEFCEVCQMCSDTCPTQAITHLSIDDPENKAHSYNNQPGIRKYYLDAQKCLLNWYNLGFGSAPFDCDCGICIGVCPYNKPQEWHHDLIKVVTRIPGLNSLARYFDEFFGYGGIADAQTLADFWRKDI